MAALHCIYVYVTDVSHAIPCHRRYIGVYTKMSKFKIGKLSHQIYIGDFTNLVYYSELRVLHIFRAYWVLIEKFYDFCIIDRFPEATVGIHRLSLNVSDLCYRSTELLCLSLKFYIVFSPFQNCSLLIPFLPIKFVLIKIFYCRSILEKKKMKIKKWNTSPSRARNFNLFHCVPGDQ